MRNLKDKVLHCLEVMPETRNSDTKLTSAIWFNFYREKLFTNSDGKLCVELVKLYELPNQDDVKRVRAKIQNPDKKTGYRGIFLPTDPVIIKRRRINQKMWEGWNQTENALRTNPSQG